MTSSPAAHHDSVTDGTEGANRPDGPAGAGGAGGSGGSAGRVVRIVVGSLLGAIGSGAAFALMASNRQFALGVPLGTLFVGLAVFGLLLAAGTLDPSSDAQLLLGSGGRRSRRSLSLSPALARFVEVLFFGALFWWALRAAVHGALPWPRTLPGVLVTAAFIALVITVFRLGRSLEAWSDGRALLKRHGFWLVVLGALLYLPKLGAFGFFDPWESHYGEVAREILARDDWISLWWAQDGFFFSKPVLDFWIQALSFSALGVSYGPEQMLAGALEGHLPGPEWAARIPVFLLSTVASYALYKAAAAAFGRRVGFLGGLVLLTTPFWALISRQSITDMPYVAPLCVAMACLLTAFRTDPARVLRPRTLSLGQFEVQPSAAALILGAIAFVSLPQILYLGSRNVTLDLISPPVGFLSHGDTFLAGSGLGNCELALPGNQACVVHSPAIGSAPPSAMALIWALALLGLIWMYRRETNLQKLLFVAAWFFTALATLGKGAPGLVLPLFVGFAFIGVQRRWRDIERMQLVALVLVVACVVLPWFVQMYLRHGDAFPMRLLVHDMYKRAFEQVHHVNPGIDLSLTYYVWQLGYGLFPWTGFCAAGLLWWLRRGDSSRDGEAQSSVFLALWLISAFGLFSITLTKFHHYILPAVPPAALLAGVVLDRALPRRRVVAPGSTAPYLLTCAVAALAMLVGLVWILGGTFDGSSSGSVSGASNLAGPILTLILGLALWVGGAVAYRPKRQLLDFHTPFALRYESMMLAWVGFASAAIVALAGRDMFTTREGDVAGQGRLIQLFTYNYRRPWPDSLDFNSVFIAFTLLAVAACLLVVSRHLRTHATVLLGVTAVAWIGWTANVYLVRTAPHWGQRDTTLAYYANRSGPDEPLVAYQLNWKGENFYTGNRLVSFKKSGGPFKDWISEQREAGVETFFVATEQGRIRVLERELGDDYEVEVLVPKSENNKFTMARIKLPPRGETDDEPEAGGAVSGPGFAGPYAPDAE